MLNLYSRRAKVVRKKSCDRIFSPWLATKSVSPDVIAGSHSEFPLLLIINLLWYHGTPLNNLFHLTIRQRGGGSHLVTKESKFCCHGINVWACASHTFTPAKFTLGEHTNRSAATFRVVKTPQNRSKVNARGHIIICDHNGCLHLNKQEGARRRCATSCVKHDSRFSENVQTGNGCSNKLS